MFCHNTSEAWIKFEQKRPHIFSECLQGIELNTLFCLDICAIPGKFGSYFNDKRMKWVIHNFRSFLYAITLFFKKLQILPLRMIGQCRVTIFKLTRPVQKEGGIEPKSITLLYSFLFKNIILFFKAYIFLLFNPS